MSPTTDTRKLCRLSEITYEVFSEDDQGEDLAKALQQLETCSGPLGVDTETTGLHPINDRVRLIQIGTAEHAVIVDLDGFRVDGARQVDFDQPGLRELKALLQSKKPKVLQNAAFDLNFLRGEGVVLGGLIFDTMFAAKVKNSGSGAPNNLGALVERELGEPMPKELQKANWAGDITDEMFAYSARDACALVRLAPLLEDKLLASRVTDRVSLYDIFLLELMCLRPFAAMQWHGFGFDQPAAVRLKAELLQEEKLKKAEFLAALDGAVREEHPEDATKWLPRNPDGSFNTNEKTKGSIRLGTKIYAGFNPRSPQQMAPKLEDAGILLPPNDKGLPSLDQNLLSFLRTDYKLIDQFLVWKEWATKASQVETLLEAFAPTGRIHAGYRQMGTDTGRASCAAPNLQQVNREKEFRSLFVARDGYVLVVADFSQIELRVAAELSGEDRMLEAYRAGRDLHTETAVLMTGKTFDEVTKSERQSSKVANFGLLYGAGAATLRKQASAQYGIDLELEEARDIVDGFRRAYPKLHEWQQDQGSQTTASVFTKYGRRRLINGRNDKYTTRINTVVQGTAGDICKIAIAMIYEKINGNEDAARLIAQVHDELVLEVREDLADYWSVELKACMEEAGAVVCRQVPIVAEVSSGKTWADAK